MTPDAVKLVYGALGIGIGVILWAVVCRGDTMRLTAKGYGLEIELAGARQEKLGALAQAAAAVAFARATKGADGSDH